MPPKRGTEYECDCPLGCGAKVKNVPAHIRGSCPVAEADRERLERERDGAKIPAAYRGERRDSDADEAEAE